jgi:hypothetical protein
MLKQDPAASWLPGTPWSIRLASAAVWSLPILANLVYWLVFAPFFYGWLWPLHFLYYGWISMSFLLTLGLFTQARRIGRQVRAAVIRSRVKQVAVAGALPVDDWAALEPQPDGRIVSLVGWVRARATLKYPLGGRPAVGLVLGCRTRIKEYRAGSARSSLVGWAVWGARRVRFVYSIEQTYAGVMESVNDFDLVDEHGRAIPIRVAGARLIGPSNTFVQAGDIGGQMALSSLDMPLAVEPVAWDVLALHDGDPVMVIGFKTTIVDAGEAGARQAPVRTAVASSPNRPMLIYPIAGGGPRPAEAGGGAPGTGPSAG